ncbi:phosphatase PAP2 family protein [Saccharopolyspora sp. K220]|uniref:phosphatase PAP2 family protein n=1 Tax=Saccharopolyspora soli TaxID=2926618 RepID=UPI001F56D85C|nr:phosphatase PAP2 family protein [Saccharopolyspora soli]MCI2423363.1 phosphatase PAP2 family protein [Saccharopolyspora soli]
MNTLHAASPRTVPERSGPLRGHRRLLGAALGYLVALGLTCLVFVWTRDGQRLDGWLVPRAERGGGYEQQTTLVEPAKTVLSYFGDPAVLVVLLGMVLLVGALSKRFLAGVAGVAAVLCSVGIARVLKLLVVRPDLGVDGSTTHNSFPSGHAAVAMGLLLAFLLVLPGRARRWVAVPGVAGVSVIASATMITGWHRFSDVVGAVLLAAALSCLAAALTHRYDARDAGLSGLVWAGGGLIALVVAVVLPGGGVFSAMAAASGCTMLAVAPMLVLLR